MDRVTVDEGIKIEQNVDGALFLRCHLETTDKRLSVVIWQPNRDLVGYFQELVCELAAVENRLLASSL